MRVILKGMLKTYREWEAVEIGGFELLSIDELKLKLNIPDHIPVYAVVNGSRVSMDYHFDPSDFVLLYPIVIGG